VVVAAAMGVDAEEREKKVILIVCGKVFSFSCKIPMWHVRIGGCKHAVLHPIRIEFNLFFPSINYFPKLQIDTIWRKNFTFYWYYFFFLLPIGSNRPISLSHRFSLSLSLGIDLSLCFPQDLVKTASFSNCTQLGMFLFYAFFSFHIHFLSVLSFWSNGFVFFKELFLYVCALNQSQ
jgi:hypothetical protein